LKGRGGMNRSNNKSPKTKRRRRIAKMPEKAVLSANQAKKIQAELLIADASDAEQVAAALIRFEHALRRRGTKALEVAWAIVSPSSKNEAAIKTDVIARQANDGCLAGGWGRSLCMMKDLSNYCRPNRPPAPYP
jgi:hypothetical protein